MAFVKCLCIGLAVSMGGGELYLTKVILKEEGEQQPHPAEESLARGADFAQPSPSPTNTTSGQPAAFVPAPVIQHAPLSFPQQ